MARARPPNPTAPQIRGILCPYCGNISADPRRCDRCAGHFDPLSRQATQNAMGPWYIRDPAGPFRPGCSYETIRDLIRRGKVVRESIIRGPTTRQFWNFAARTPTVAHLLGVCHNCFGEVSPQDYSCASCGAVFSPETDRQHLGLAPVHLLPGEAAPEIIATAVDARPAPPLRPQPARVPRPGPAPREPVVEEPARSGLSAGAKFGLGLLILVFASGVGYATWRLANMVGQTPTVSQAQPAKPAPVSTAPGPGPTRPGAEGAVSTPPSSAPTPAAPAPSAPVVTTPPPVEPPAPSNPVAAFQDDIAAALRSDTLNEAALLSTIQQWKSAHPDHAAEADALAELVRKRAQQLRLRKTP